MNPHTHRRRADDFDDDASPLIKYRNELKWLVSLALSLVGGFLLASGWDFKTPSSQFSAMNARISTLDSRVDSLTELRPLIEAIAVISCMSVSEQDAAQHRLPCRRLLGDYVSPVRNERQPQQAPQPQRTAP